MEILGIDIGGSGIKGAPVDTEKGELSAERHRIPTPNPSTPDSVASVIAEITQHFEWYGPVGCGFPAVVQNGISRTAANIHKDWVDTHVAELFSERAHLPVRVVNDADAAGMAEITFGAGRGRTGVVLIVTIGTGLGTSVFIDGRLLPNTELGHIQLHGRDAELFASDAVRKKEDLSWKEWAERFDQYLCALEDLIWPDLIILGGGASKKHKKFTKYLTTRAEVLPAQLRNEAGIIGAALAARSLVPEAVE